jgi:hypothetical protein
MKMNPRAFISHSGEDRVFAERLATDLRGNGVDVWLSVWEITAGDSLRRKIEQGLTQSDIFVLVLSRSSVVRPWVQEELDAALVRRISGLCRKIIPVVLDDCEMPPFVASSLWLDMRDYQYEVGLSELLKSVFDIKTKPPLGSPPTFVSIEPESSETNYFKIKPIADLKAKCLAVTIPDDAEVKTISVHFVSKTWGFKLFLRIPESMQCSALVDLLQEKLELQTHIELKRTRGRVLLFWQLQKSDGRLCDPESTLMMSEIFDGDTIYMHATVKEQHVDYSVDWSGKIQGMHIGDFYVVDRWTA